MAEWGVARIFLVQGLSVASDFSSQKRHVKRRVRHTENVNLARKGRGASFYVRRGRAEGQPRRKHPMGPQKALQRQHRAPQQPRTPCSLRHANAAPSSILGPGCSCSTRWRRRTSFVLRTTFSHQAKTLGGEAPAPGRPQRPRQRGPSAEFRVDCASPLEFLSTSSVAATGSNASSKRAPRRPAAERRWRAVLRRGGGLAAQLARARVAAEAKRTCVVAHQTGGLVSRRHRLDGHSKKRNRSGPPSGCCRKTANRSKRAAYPLLRRRPDGTPWAPAHGVEAEVVQLSLNLHCHEAQDEQQRRLPTLGVVDDDAPVRVPQTPRQRQSRLV